MKTTILILAALASAVLTSCSASNTSPANTQHDSMPGMTAEEHAKMKQR